MNIGELTQNGKSIIIEDGISEFLSATAQWAQRTFITPLWKLPVIDDICYQVTVSKLHNRMESEEELEDILETVFNFKGCGRYRSIRPQQVLEEFAELAVEVNSHNPDTILEIGTAKGGSYYVWNRYINPDKIVCIDFSLSQEYIRFLSSMADGTETSFLVENSLDKETVDIVGKEFDGDIDFIFSDGAGPYEAKMSDFENYKKYLSNDGIIAFHDIGPRPDSPKSGGEQFWKEMKKNHKTKEIINGPIGYYNGKECYMGIGIVYL